MWTDFQDKDTIDRANYSNNITQQELNCKGVVDQILLVHSEILWVHKMMSSEIIYNIFSK